MINNNNSNIIICPDKINNTINNTNLDIFKSEINAKESIYLKNDNKLIDKIEVIENKNIKNELEK